MSQQLETSNDLVVPHAAHLSNQFLNDVFQRCAQEEFGLKLAPVERKGRFTLIGKIRFGNIWARSKERRFVVFADPAGRSLHVGWQVTTDDNMLAHALSSWTSTIANMGDIIDARPEFQRQLMTVLHGFNDLVFEPAVDMLVEAVEQRAQPQLLRKDNRHDGPFL